jgi:hypothetical protein
MQIESKGPLKYVVDRVVNPSQKKIKDAGRAKGRATRRIKGCACRALLLQRVAVPIENGEALDDNSNGNESGDLDSRSSSDED